MTLGIPKIRINLLLSPCLKNVILPRFPNKWKKATRTKAVLKSIKNNARGRKMVEEPNPAMVPITSDINAKIKKKKNSAMEFIS